MNGLLEDIKFGWRNAVKKPAIALLIVITFGLGIGANSAIFSVVYNTLLAPLPYSDGDRLVRLQQNQPLTERMDFNSSVQSFLDYRKLTQSMSELVEYHSMTYTLYGHGDPQEVLTGVVSWNYFDMLGIKPILGRAFVEGEDEVGSEPLILISNRYWIENFAGDTDIVGRSLEMNNRVHKILGVLPPMPAYPDDNDIYIGASTCPWRGSEGMIANRRPGMLTLFGKLKQDYDITQGSNEINTIAGQLAQQYPDAYRANEGYSANLVSLRDEMVGDSARTFYLLLAIAGLVVLIASANVANLNLARLSSRNQELAIREALGANPKRIARQLLTESTLFSLVGGIFGTLMAYSSLGLLSEFASGYTSLSSEVKMDSSILMFSLVLSLITGLLSGSAAVFNRGNINSSLKEGGDKITVTTSGKRLRQALLVTQFALSFIILTTATLVSVSLYKLNNQDAGYDADKVLNVSFAFNFSNYTNGQEVRAFAKRILAEIKTVGGVDQASLSGAFPVASTLAGPIEFEAEAQNLSADEPRPRALASTVSEDYHKVLNIPLKYGRLFSPQDDENNQQVVIVNQSLADHFFESSNAIGKRLSLDAGANWLTVVGVVADIRSAGLDQEEGDAFYTPFLQRPTMRVKLLVKSKGDPLLLAKPISDFIHQLDPQQAIASINTMSEIREQWLASPRLVAILVGLFGLLAFMITLSGVVGVVAYNVSQRSREIGIRMAIGATPKKILNMLLVDGSKLTIIGMLVGAASMIMITPAIGDFLYQTSPFDPSIYLTCSLLLFVVALLAMAAPAKQATRLDPMHALRDE
jgi:putative ABC transport system permease protein